MEQSEIKIANAIKVAQQALIENTADLNDEVRAKVYSKFQSVKYKFLNTQEFQAYTTASGCFGFYLPEDNTIYFLDSGDISKVQNVSVLHEMLHAVTTVNYDKNNPFNSISGFKQTGTFSTGRVTVISSIGRGINEAATQFFAEKFLNNSDTTIYPFEVHLFSILCEECDYETIKNAYFSSSIENLKKAIRNGFKLKDDCLIDNLFNLMDIFGVISGKDTNYFDGFLIMKNCYATLLQMKINKLMYLTNYVASEKDIIKNFDAFKYLTKQLNPFYKSFFEEFLAEVELNKTNLLSSSSRTKLSFESAMHGGASFANAIINIDVKYLEDNYNYFKQNALEILKQLCSESMFCQKDEISGQYLKVTNQKLIYLFLGLLHNRNDKIDLSHYSEGEKYEFICLALFNRYSVTEDLNKNCKNLYQHFYPKDLVNFINSGYYECDTFFNEKAMEYIWSEIKNVHPRLFEVKEFALAYKNVRNKHIAEEKNLTK